MKTTQREVIQRERRMFETDELHAGPNRNTNTRVETHMHARMTGNEGKGSKREEERRVAQLNTGKGIGRKKGRIKQEKGERYSQKHSDQREKERRKSQSKGSQVGKRGGRAPRKTKDTTENRGQGDRGLLTQKKVVVKRL